MALPILALPMMIVHRDQAISATLTDDQQDALKAASIGPNTTIAVVWLWHGGRGSRVARSARAWVNKLTRAYLRDDHTAMVNVLASFDLYHALNDCVGLDWYL